MHRMQRKCELVGAIVMVHSKPIMVMSIRGRCSGETMCPLRPKDEASLAFLAQQLSTPIDYHLSVNGGPSLLKNDAISHDMMYYLVGGGSIILINFDQMFDKVPVCPPTLKRHFYARVLFTRIIMWVKWQLHKFL